MMGEPTREVVVDATLNDTYDGMVRLLSDAQRFGLELRALALTTAMDGTVSATVTLSVPSRIDAQLIAMRLARHPTVRNLEAQEVQQTRQEDGRARLKPLAP